MGKPGDTPAAVIEVGDASLAAHAGRHAGDHRSSIGHRPACAPLLFWSSDPSSSFGTKLEWFESLPLFGQRIVVTRPRQDACAGGGRAREPWVPKCSWRRRSRCRPITDPAPLDRAIDRLADYEWLVFTSANGVRFFLRRLEERGRDLRALGHLKLAAIGPTTAEALAGYHLRADLVPGFLSLRGPRGGPGPGGRRPQDLARPRRSRPDAPQG